jgi:hypothetical protein
MPVKLTPYMAATLAQMAIVARNALILKIVNYP